jgi:hypothetical protein
MRGWNITKIPGVKFHDNLFCCFRVLTRGRTDGQTERYTKNNSQISQTSVANAPNNVTAWEERKQIISFFCVCFVGMTRGRYLITSEIVCHNSDVSTPHFSIYCLVPCVAHSLSFPVFWSLSNVKCVFLQHSSPCASCPQQIALRAQYFSHSCCHLPSLLLINLESDAHHSSVLCV